ncbi:hypothetical protein BGZ70_005269, partial [Mortierella alpina]
YVPKPDMPDQDYTMELMSNIAIITPPYFRPGDDPLDWLQMFKKAIKANGWNDTRALGMASAMMNEAAESAIEPPIDDLTTFKQFEEAFLLIFQLTDYKKNALQEAKQYRQADDEDVEIFISNMMKLFRRADITDDAKKAELFAEAANEAIYAKFLRKNPTTFREMKTIARDIDHHRRALAQHKNKNHDSPHEKAMPWNQRPYDAPKNKPLNTPASRKTESERTSEQDLMDDLTTRLGKLTMHEVNAFMASMGYCPVVPVNQSPVVCYKCSQPGHLARNCTMQHPERAQINFVDVYESNPVKTSRALGFLWLATPDDTDQDEDEDEDENDIDEPEKVEINTVAVEIPMLPNDPDDEYPSTPEDELEELRDAYQDVFADDVPELEDWSQVLLNTVLSRLTKMADNEVPSQSFCRSPGPEHEAKDARVSCPDYCEPQEKRCGPKDDLNRFPRNLKNILREMPFTDIFVDDIRIHSETMEPPREHVQQVFERLYDYGVKVKDKIPIDSTADEISCRTDRTGMNGENDQRKDQQCNSFEVEGDTRP